MNQIYIKDGHVIDHATQCNHKKDILIQNGTITNQNAFSPQDADLVINAENCIVTAGLIDHHAHLYPLSNIGIPAESVSFSSGVTTAVDAGSTGCDTFEKHLPFLQQSKLTIKTFLNVCSTGLDSLPEQMEDIAPAHINTEKIKDIVDKHRNLILGLKIRIGKEITGNWGYAPLEKAACLAHELDLPVMVHCTNHPDEMSVLLQHLKKGDILTHVYMDKGDTILDKNGKIKQSVIDARERGVLFQAADARAHFSYPVSKQAIEQGFLPDIIATDLTKFSMYLRPTTFTLTNQMAKYHALGMSLEQVVARCTHYPAAQMGLSASIGCLSAGAVADIAVFRPFSDKIEFADRPYPDPNRHTFFGTRGFEPVLTMKQGAVVYRSMTF